MKYLLSITFICFSYIRFATSSFCYWNTACSYRYFSSVTPYSAVRGDIRDSVINIKECEPVSIWGLFRHGRTHPAAKRAGKMKEAISIRDLVVSSYEKGRCSLCAQDIDNLRDWPVNYDLFEKTNALQDEGYQDMFGIGYRLKTVFPQFLDKLEHESYLFKPSDHHWSKESAEAFVKGLGSQNLVIDNQKILNGPDFIFNDANDRIQRRLGIDYSLTDDNITALYDLCRYSWSGLHNKASPWCALFTTEDLKVLEYIEDLVHYYKNGYGRKNASQFGHKPLQDLLQKFQRAKEGKGNIITAYFILAETLEATFTALGWFKDSQPLTAVQKGRDRFWRTSKFSAFSSNLFMVLNRCTNKDVTDYHVMFYMNEEPLRSVCEGGICSWGEFERILSPFLNSTQRYSD
ncbi:multiple inositol polyphosphate phosphatase 1-like isoform X2 [Choristoneura fumiferana]|uniref:multiple inositol polyphosphate phosphatase 1-like isoform X2 n=1 Tax=Choristoneura fumiferana TaxID=7141 RepID=UPI003D15EBD6